MVMVWKRTILGEILGRTHWAKKWSSCISLPLDKIPRRVSVYIRKNGSARLKIYNIHHHL
jgi:hypothetical protein